MNKLTISFSLALLLLVIVSSPVIAQESRPLILEHANVINPADDAPLLDQTIVLQGGKIQSISSVPAIMPGERMDLRGAWVLPGLIDAHVHATNITAARSPPPSHFAHTQRPFIRPKY